MARIVFRWLTWEGLGGGVPLVITTAARANGRTHCAVHCPAARLNIAHSGSERARALATTRDQHTREWDDGTVLIHTVTFKTPARRQESQGQDGVLPLQQRAPRRRQVGPHKGRSPSSSHHRLQGVSFTHP
jgi:hypothetical protein